MNDLEKRTNKQIFIDQIKSQLKLLGFKKKNNYWYKQIDKHLCCVNVQGSQWDKNDYYVEIGFCTSIKEGAWPTLLQWFCSHRCNGKNGDKNVSPEDMFAEMERVFDKVRTTNEIIPFLHDVKAVKVGEQFWF